MAMRIGQSVGVVKYDDDDGWNAGHMAKMPPSMATTKIAPCDNKGLRVMGLSLTNI